MPDVFISYSREHREAVVLLAEELRQYALDVWFDVELRAGTIFADAIQEQLSAARSVVVLWTRDALRKGVKGWVYSEADWARQHGKLIQAKLEEVVLHPPFFTSEIPPVDLSALRGRHPQLPTSGAQELLRQIGELTQRPGLASFVVARKSDASLLAWERKYPNDRLAKLDNSIIQEARIRRARAKGLGNELRSLAEDIQAAPLDEGGAWAASFSYARANVRSFDEGFATHSSDFLDFGSSDALRLVALLCSKDVACGIVIFAAGRAFAIDGVSGLRSAMMLNGIPVRMLQALLLTRAESAALSDAAELYEAVHASFLPVYGPTEVMGLVGALNDAAGMDGAQSGLQAWGPQPAPGRSVVVYDGDGLVISAFTTEVTSPISYRFDYRGRSIVIAGGDEALAANASVDADVVVSRHESSLVVSPTDGERFSIYDEVLEFPLVNGAINRIRLTGVDGHR